MRLHCRQANSTPPGLNQINVFAQTQRIGVTGYPTLLALAQGRAQVLSLGCRPLADVEAALQPLLEQPSA